jgi:hypothetical protein
VRGGDGPARGNRTALVIDNLPSTANTDEAIRNIAERARQYGWSSRHPGLRAATQLQIADVGDESSRRAGTCFVCVLKPGADPEQVRDQLLDIYGVFATVEVALPRPLTTMVRKWVAAYRDEDVMTSLSALEEAIAAAKTYDIL